MIRIIIMVIVLIKYRWHIGGKRETQYRYYNVWKGMEEKEDE